VIPRRRNGRDRERKKDGTFWRRRNGGGPGGRSTVEKGLWSRYSRRLPSSSEQLAQPTGVFEKRKKRR
jgi:hypothetical protein